MFIPIPDDRKSRHWLFHGNVIHAMYARSILLIASILQDVLSSFLRVESGHQRILIDGHVLASFLRVESGHQRILIDGRDPYVGFFTQIEFNELTCVSAVTIHCLKPLTGAEEIDILYSECERDNWEVAHYTNTKETFTLRNEVIARRLSICSPLELAIIDVQVESSAAVDHLGYILDDMVSKNPSSVLKIMNDEGGNGKLQLISEQKTSSSSTTKNKAGFSIVLLFVVCVKNLLYDSLCA
ncbi:unnamed protein product [Strongylus vulgaris]|uniref:Uncharacterized protein n=1 Tax=Strongylus vulgaris TaxID=40348 RepID=A0A3P7LZW1_STRVU|nr:unnamed protein product [Strongylus vulgaris]